MLEQSVALQSDQCLVKYHEIFPLLIKTERAISKAGTPDWQLRLESGHKSIRVTVGENIKSTSWSWYVVFLGIVASR